MHKVYDSVLIYPSNRVGIVIIEFYSKIHKNIQTVLMLLEKGFQDEARVLLRVALEKIFIMRAMTIDQSKIELWLNEQNRNKDRLIKNIQNSKPGLGHLKDELETSQIEVLKDKTSFLDWAKYANMEEEYNVDYTIFSGDVHLSSKVVRDDLVIENNEIEGIIIGPNLENSKELMHIAKRYALISLKAVSDFFDLNLKKYDSVLNTLNAEFQKAYNGE